MCACVWCVWCPVRGIRLTFSVGPVPVPKLQMIERHYFRNRLVKSYDFEFGFCIPNSTNTWDATYSLPPLDDSLGTDRRQRYTAFPPGVSLFAHVSVAARCAVSSLLTGCAGGA